MEQVYTTSELAPLLKTTPDGITRLVRKGLLVPLPGFKEYRFAESAVNAYLSGETAEAKPKRKKYEPGPTVLSEHRKMREELEAKGEWISVKR